MAHNFSSINTSQNMVDSVLAGRQKTHLSATASSKALSVDSLGSVQQAGGVALQNIASSMAGEVEKIMVMPAQLLEEQIAAAQKMIMDIAGDFLESAQKEATDLIKAGNNVIGQAFKLVDGATSAISGVVGDLTGSLTDAVAAAQGVAASIQNKLIQQIQAIQGAATAIIGAAAQEVMAVLMALLKAVLSTLPTLPSLFKIPAIPDIIPAWLITFDLEKLLSIKVNLDFVLSYVPNLINEGLDKVTDAMESFSKSIDDAELLTTEGILGVGGESFSEWAIGPKDEKAIIDKEMQGTVGNMAKRLAKRKAQLSEPLAAGIGDIGLTISEGMEQVAGLIEKVTPGTLLNTLTGQGEKKGDDITLPQVSEEEIKETESKRKEITEASGTTIDNIIKTLEPISNSGGEQGTKNSTTSDSTDFKWIIYQVIYGSFLFFTSPNVVVNQEDSALRKLLEEWVEIPFHTLRVENVQKIKDRIEEQTNKYIKNDELDSYGNAIQEFVKTASGIGSLPSTTIPANYEKVLIHEATLGPAKEAAEYYIKLWKAIQELPSEVTAGLF